MDRRRTLTPAWQSVLALAWPVLLQQWLVLAVSLSDRLLAGRFLDGLAKDEQEAVQAAHTTATYLGWFLSSCTVLVNAGSTALVAHLVGAKDRGSANAVLHQSLALALIVGTMGAGALFVLMRPMLALLGLQGAAQALAADYLVPLLAVLPLHMAATAGIACLVGAGDTKTGMWVFGAEAVINLPLAWGFFLVFGFVGIAVGTALAQALGAVAVLIVLLHGRAGLRIEGQQFGPRGDLLRRLLRVSVPAAVDTISMQVGYLWFLRQVNQLGDTASAAHGIALGWEAMGYLTGVGFGTAAMTLVGQAQGAGRPDLAARAGWTAFGLGAAAMTLMGVLFFTLAEPMFRLFCPHATQEGIVSMGVPVLRLVAFGMPACAACMIFVQALRGAGDARWPVLFTWIGFFGVRLPLTAYLISHGWGLWGAWLAMNADLHVRGLCLLLRFASGRWRRLRV